MLLLFFGIFWGMYLCTFYVGEVFFFFGGGSKMGTGRKKLLENSFVFLYASPLHYSQHAPSRNAM